MSPSVLKRVEAFFSDYPKRSYPKNHIIVFANEEPEHVYFLVRGSVRMYDISYRGDEVIVNMFKPPSFFPVSWAINRNHNQFFYSTDEESEVYVAPVDETVAFLKSDPDVMFDLLGRVYRGIDGVLGRMVQLMSGSAKSRVLYELIIECRRSQLSPENGKYTLNINEGGLAARTGLTRETVSREIHKLKEKKLMGIGPKGIIIKDIGAMERMLGEAV